MIAIKGVIASKKISFEKSLALKTNRFVWGWIRFP